MVGIELTLVGLTEVFQLLTLFQYLMPYLLKVQVA
jgi:hypothetical protein